MLTPINKILASMGMQAVRSNWTIVMGATANIDFALLFGAFIFAAVLVFLMFALGGRRRHVPMMDNYTAGENPAEWGVTPERYQYAYAFYQPIRGCSPNVRCRTERFLRHAGRTPCVRALPLPTASRRRFLLVTILAEWFCSCFRGCCHEFLHMLPQLLGISFLAMGIGLLLMGLGRQFTARIQRRIGPPFYQAYLDVLKCFSKTSITHGFVMDLGSIMSLAGLIATAYYVPFMQWTPTGSGSLVVMLYLMTIGYLGMAMGVSASGNPQAPIGISRALALMFGYKVPLAMVIIAMIVVTGTSDLLRIVGLQQGGIEHCSSGSFRWASSPWKLPFRA